MRFDHLNIPNHWQQEFTRYPQGYTILEALMNWTTQVDNMVDVMNNWTKYMDTFVEQFDTDLQGQVRKILTEWNSRGIIQVIISDIIEGRISSLEKRAEQALSDIYIDPVAFGAKGDGKADDTAAINEAIQYMITTYGGRGTLRFPHGRVFKVTDTIVGTGLNNATIDLNGSTLDFSTLPINRSINGIEFLATYHTAKLLNADTKSGGVIANVADITGIAVGDFVRIYSDKIWDRGRTSTKIGELNHVVNITSPGTIELGTPTFDTYETAKNAKIQKIAPNREITICNGTLIGAEGNDQLNGIFIQAGIGCLIDNVSLYDWDKRHIVLDDCFETNVSNCKMVKANHLTQAYGISFVNACRHCVAKNNHFERIRHALSTNNDVGWSWGITRNLIWDGNTVTNTAKDLSGGLGDAIDTHAGCESITIVNNVVNGSDGNGINIEGKSAIVSNNTFVNIKNSAIYLRPFVDEPSHFVVTGNLIRRNIGDDTGNGDYGIRAYADVADIDHIVIADNLIESTISPVSVNGSDTTGSVIRQATISGNTAKTTRIGAPFSLSHIQSGSITGNNSTGITTCMTLGNSKGVSVTGNSGVITGTGNTGYGIYVSGNSDGIAITGNSYRNTGTIVSSAGVGFAGTVKNSAVIGNVLRDFSIKVGNALSENGNIEASNI